MKKAILIFIFAHSTFSLYSMDSDDQDPRKIAGEFGWEGGGKVANGVYNIACSVISWCKKQEAATEDKNRKIDQEKSLREKSRLEITDNQKLRVERARTLTAQEPQRPVSSLPAKSAEKVQEAPKAFESLTQPQVKEEIRAAIPYNKGTDPQLFIHFTLFDGEKELQCFSKSDIGSFEKEQNLLEECLQESFLKRRLGQHTSSVISKLDAEKRKIQFNHMDEDAKEGYLIKIELNAQGVKSATGECKRVEDINRELEIEPLLALLKKRSGIYQKN